MTPYYVTTPIYYVNDRPHIGHCYTTLIADVAARMHRLIGRNVFFLTGTDEHAEKVVVKAAENGVSPLEWADRNAAEFRKAFAFMNFSNDDFVRTTEERHKSKASAYIQKLVDSGDIELGDYEGWWDGSQEEYLTETVAKEHDYKSPVTGRPLEKRKEQNYFFRLDKYAGWLEEQIAGGTIRVLPEARKNEVLGRIRQGLQKVPVSRRIKAGDADWGVRMPNDPEHRVYVWIEALCNYLTVVDTPERRTWWPKAGSTGPECEAGVGCAPVVHLMAKDIVWFHAVIWPAMLKALGERAPRTVYAHAYFIAEGRKMSKSLGNFIEIDQLRAYAGKYSLDALRWFLVTQGPLGANDADFAYQRFVEVYNADLANGIGNATSRVSNMIAKYFEGKVPGRDGTVLTGNEHWIDRAEQDVGAFLWMAERCEWNAVTIGCNIVAQIDEYISGTRPFELAKHAAKLAAEGHAAQAEARWAEIGTILYQCAEQLRIASLLLYPAMPEKMAELWRRWNCRHLVDPGDCNSAFVAPLAELAKWGGKHGLKPGQEVVKGDALFMRADAGEAAPG
ncbi:MAG: methionine--tRNA ligase [Leptolyngbya sp. PLA3]|nr:MAG: methionine--tRNA ligase [Cyanobacteria bacterium CYA]MCE7968486.1 methionine--tRNA ligase [Leptolyngbya sp. PL-A3]